MIVHCLIGLVIATALYYAYGMWFIYKRKEEVLNYKLMAIKHYLETYGQDIGSWGGWSGIDGRNIKVTILKMIEEK